MAVVYTLEETSNPDLVLALSPDEMTAIGEEVIKSIKYRLSNGVDVNDRPAPALTEAYRKAKIKKGAKPIRDMRLTGKTLDSIKVVSATENGVEIGFDNEAAAQIVVWDKKYDQMWGLAPTDAEVAEVEVGEQLRADSSKNQTQQNNFLLIEGA